MRAIATIVGTFAGFIMAGTLTDQQMPYAIAIAITIITINAKKLGLKK